MGEESGQDIRSSEVHTNDQILLCSCHVEFSVCKWTTGFKVAEKLALVAPIQIIF